MRIYRVINKNTGEHVYSVPNAKAFAYSTEGQAKATVTRLNWMLGKYYSGTDDYEVQGGTVTWDE